MSDDITEAQAQDILRQFNEGKQNMHTFFSKVIASEDTTKTGNLNTEELGMSKLPLRTYKELELFCKEIADDNNFSDYFKKMGEVQTSTSLSKDAKLLELAVTMKKELADVTKKAPTKNKGWFKKDTGGQTE